MHQVRSEGAQRDILAERREIDEAVAGQTIPSLFQETVAKHADREALRWKEGVSWTGISWAEYGERVRQVANGLLSIGFRPGEFANLLSANRQEAYAADVGILHTGGTAVSLYNSLAPEQIEYIVNHCEATVMFLENPEYFERVQSIRAKLPKVRTIVLFEGADRVKDDDVLSWDDLLAAGRDYAKKDPGAFEEHWEAVRPEKLATLIYTSGTTGPPKGVMVTHRNVCWTAESMSRTMPRPPHLRHISYLPLAHIAERMAGHYGQIKEAMHCHFCPDPRKIAEYLAEVRPQFFFAVPRIWEKLHSALTSAIENNPDESQKAFAKMAIEVGLEVVRLEQAGEAIPAELQAKAKNAEMVTGMIRQRVGLDQVEIAGTGAAPIAKEILEWFAAVGVRIAEVYGQSEDTGPTSWNRPDHIKFGTVGPAIPGAEVKLAADGELLVRGGNVTDGYYKEPELTRETFDEEGWLHSGDIAEIDDEGFIKIVDRKKEILITAGGKNIAPSNVESLLKQKPLVGQACLIGDKRPYCSALIVLDPETSAGWAKAKGLPADLTELAKHPDVRAEIEAYVAEINGHLHNQEQVKKFTILGAEWTPETGELTPTLKMKRKVVNEKYAAAIESMY